MVLNSFPVVNVENLYINRNTVKYLTYFHISGQCIPLDWQCDGEIDCIDKLDEWDNICSK